MPLRRVIRVAPSGVIGGVVLTETLTVSGWMFGAVRTSCVLHGVAVKLPQLTGVVTVAAALSVLAAGRVIDGAFANW